MGPQALDPAVAAARAAQHAANSPLGLGCAASDPGGVGGAEGGEVGSFKWGVAVEVMSADEGQRGSASEEIHQARKQRR